jgi:acyl carrier protein
MQCEDEFGITLDDEDVDKADTVGQFLKLLTKTIG